MVNLGERPPAESNSNDQFVLPESDSRNDAISHLLTKDQAACDPWIYLNGLHFDEQVCFLHSFYYTPESDSRNPESDSDNG